ncbi:Nucleotide-sugar transporter family protein [Forsythia ovata]|uniref:Nucleotide-sugar transporter family protein n=1 Tax=Forsythia ovata TaxID=205694 RepID=A0ABD1U4R6_9LAMI
MDPTTEWIMDPTTEWMYNLLSSIVIIAVHKLLMDHHGFSFELLIYVLFANFSAVGMNVSLMWNSLGFYQAAKVGIIPVTLLLETVFDKIQYSPLTRYFITIVVYGISICSLIGVSGVSVDAKGFVAAFIAVWSTSLQQYAAPMQAASLLLLGPFLDYWLTNKRIDAFEFNKEIMVLIILSCPIGAGYNLSQFICIERFTPISYEMFGQIKTLLILAFLNLEGGFNFLLVISMIFSVWGLIMYFGVTSEEPGWRSYSIPKSSQQKHGEVSYSSKLDDKV